MNANIPVCWIVCTKSGIRKVNPEVRILPTRLYSAYCNGQSQLLWFWWILRARSKLCPCAFLKRPLCGRCRIPAQLFCLLHTMAHAFRIKNAAVPRVSVAQMSYARIWCVRCLELVSHRCNKSDCWSTCSNRITHPSRKTQAYFQKTKWLWRLCGDNKCRKGYVHWKKVWAKGVQVAHRLSWKNWFARK